MGRTEDYASGKLTIDQSSQWITTNSGEKIQKPITWGFWTVQ